MKRRISQSAELIVGAIAGIILCMMLSLICGCTRTIYKESEIVKSDSATYYQHDYSEEVSRLINDFKQKVSVRDSVVIRDSVVLVVNQTGEVVSREVYRDRNNLRQMNETIEVLKERYDSIARAQESEFKSILSEIQNKSEIVEKPLSKWEKFKMRIGGFSIGFMTAVVFVVIVWLVRRFRTRR